MPLEKRGVNSWRITINIGYDPVTGERIRITKTIKAENKTEAQKIEKIMIAEATRKKVLNPSKMTVAAFFKYWMKHYAQPKLAERTMESYHEGFYRIDLALGHKKIDKVETKHILVFLDNLRTCPRLDGKEGTLSPATLRKTYGLLNGLFKKAAQWGFILSNPVETVDAPNYKYANKKTILTPQETGSFLLLLEKFADMKYRIWCLVAIICGLRREEVYGLQWKHINFNANTIKVEQACVYIKKKGLQIKDTKNVFSDRIVSVPESLMNLLAAYFANKDREREQLANLWQGADNIVDDFLFTTWNGRVAHPDTITKWLHKFVRIHELPVITPHSFRHMTATFLIAAGTDLTTVAGKLGHVDSTTTQRVYSHLLQKSEKQTAHTMDEILSKSIENAKSILLQSD